MRFPYREPDILRLARDVAAGLAAHPDVFPAPPFSAEEFEKAFALHDDHREAQIVTRASSLQATATKDESLGTIGDMAKSVIRYAENVHRGDDAKLQLLGWGGRRPRTLSVTELPGQPRTLEVLREGSNWVFLDWKEPMEGGQVAAYKVQRRKRDGGDWLESACRSRARCCSKARTPASSTSTGSSPSTRPVKVRRATSPVRSSRRADVTAAE